MRDNRQSCQVVAVATVDLSERALCPRCRRSLLVSDFAKNRARKNGLHTCCKECDRGRASKRTEKGEGRGKYRALRAEAFAAYGGAFCAWCGAAEQLEIDHIADNGAVERALFPEQAWSLARWLKKQGFPPGYQVLCRPCNRVKAHIAAIQRHTASERVSRALIDRLRELTTAAEQQAD